MIYTTLGLRYGRDPDPRAALGRRGPREQHVHGGSTRRIPRTRSGTTTPAMKLYKQVMAKYYPSGNPVDGLNLYGVAAAQAFVQLMYQAGKNPTRASLMKAFRNWNEPNPFLLPGNRQYERGASTSGRSTAWSCRSSRTARSSQCRRSGVGRTRAPSATMSIVSPADVGDRRGAGAIPPLSFTRRTLCASAGRTHSSVRRRPRPAGTAPSTAPSASGGWCGARGRRRRR